MRNCSILTIVLLSLQTIFGQQAQILLTEAIYTEETTGDLERAIIQYTSIIKNYPDERHAAAQALLRLGMANEKLGKVQARNFYQQIISQYPDQTEQAELAKKRLARLKAEITGSTPAQSAKFVTHIKLATLRDIYGSVSSDGKYISYVNWEHGNLAIYDIQKGVSQDVTNEGTWDGISAFADMSVWSPDNSHIAYTWFAGQEAEIRVYDVAAKQSRVLVPSRGNMLPFPYQWCQEGILVPYANRTRTQEILYLINPKSGDMRTIREFNSEVNAPKLRGGSISPDGSYLTITLKFPDRPLETHIHTMSNLAAPPLSILTQLDFDPIWSADGTYFYYTSTRHENRALYKRRITDGIIADQDELILESVDFFIPSNINPETGDLYYIGGVQNSMVMRAHLDWDGRRFGTPEVIVSSDKGRWGPALSPDGKKFVYCKRGSREIRGSYICVRQLDDGTERDYDLKLRNVEIPVGHTQLQWTPDGDKVVVTYAPVNSEGRHVYRMAFVDIGNGEVREIADLHVHRHSKAILSETRVVKYDRGKGLSLVDLQSGQATLLYAMPDSTLEAWFLSRSHDGQRIAFLEAHENDDFLAHRLSLLDLHSGTVRNLLTLERPKGFAYRHAPQWLPEDRGLLVQIADLDKKTAQFHTYDLETGVIEPFHVPLEREKDRWYHATLSPDGTSMIFAKEERWSTAWVIQNIE